MQSNELAKKHYAVLNELHNEALQSGVADSSPAYFDFLNSRLSTLDAQQPAAAATHLINEMQARVAQERPQEPPPKPAPASISAAHISAPVSRAIPSASGQRVPGKITLTREHLEAAQIAGVTPAEYAQQLLKLNEMKANGDYSDRR